MLRLEERGPNIRPKTSQASPAARLRVTATRASDCNMVSTRRSRSAHISGRACAGPLSCWQAWALTRAAARQALVPHRFLPRFLVLAGACLGRFVGSDMGVKPLRVHGKRTNPRLIPRIVPPSYRRPHGHLHLGGRRRHAACERLCDSLQRHDETCCARWRRQATLLQCHRGGGRRCGSALLR